MLLSSAQAAGSMQGCQHNMPERGFWGLDPRAYAGMQVVDFQWHASDPYTMVSVSDDNEGGTLQIWRVNDLIYMPEDQALRELEAHWYGPCYPHLLHQARCTLLPGEVWLVLL